jgi:hypothetical protein
MNELSRLGGQMQGSSIVTHAVIYGHFTELHSLVLVLRHRDNFKQLFRVTLSECLVIKRHCFNCRDL